MAGEGEGRYFVSTAGYGRHLRSYPSAPAPLLSRDRRGRGETVDVDHTISPMPAHYPRCHAPPRLAAWHPVTLLTRSKGAAGVDDDGGDHEPEGDEAEGADAHPHPQNLVVGHDVPPRIAFADVGDGDGVVHRFTEAVTYDRARLNGRVEVLLFGHPVVVGRLVARVGIELRADRTRGLRQHAVAIQEDRKEERQTDNKCQRDA